MADLIARMERRSEEWGAVPPENEYARAVRAAHRKAWREAIEMVRLYGAKR